MQTQNLNQRSCHCPNPVSHCLRCQSTHSGSWFATLTPKPKYTPSPSQRHKPQTGQTAPVSQLDISITCKLSRKSALGCERATNWPSFRTCDYLPKTKLTFSFLVCQIHGMWPFLSWFWKAIKLTPPQAAQYSLTENHCQNSTFQDQPNAYPTQLLQQPHLGQSGLSSYLMLCSPKGYMYPKWVYGLLPKEFK